MWKEHWRPPGETLVAIEAELRRCGAVVARGGAFERWDLEARMGNLGAARVRLAVEDHGHGRQLLRFRIWPRVSRFGIVGAVALAGLVGYGVMLGDAVAVVLFVGVAAWVAQRAGRECAAATGLVLETIDERRAESYVVLEPVADALATRVGVLARRQRNAIETSPMMEVVE